MKCPYCSNEMTDGFIEGGRRVYFTTERHVVDFAPDENSILLTKNNWSLFGYPYRRAFRCAQCQKIIIDCADELPDAT